MPLGHAIIVEIMRAGDFHRARTKGRVRILIGNDRDQTVTQRQMHHLADNRRIAFITGMHRHRAIAQHGFGPRGGDGNVIPLFAQGHIPFGIFLNIFIGFPPGEPIFEMPHMARNLGVLHLKVRNRGFKMRVPVHEPLAAIDQALVVHLHEHLDDGVVEIALLARRCPRRARHGERLAVPIGTRPQPLQLANDRAARLDLLLPDARQKRLTPHLAARGLSLRGHLTLGHHLRRNPGMVGAGLPQRVIPLHPVPAHQNILQRVVERMPHMQAAGHIRRRDHHGKRRMAGLGIGPGGKGLPVQPKLRNPGLGLGGGEGLFHRHRVILYLGAVLSEKPPKGQAPRSGKWRSAEDL